MSEKFYLKGVIYVIIFLLIGNTILALSDTNQTSQPPLSENQLYKYLTMASLPRKNRPITIEYPRLSCPTILTPGETFSIEIRSINYDQVYIYLETAHEPVIDSYWLPINSQIQNGNTFLSVTIPNIAPPELYNLSVIIQQYGTYFAHTQPHSINIVDEITDDYSFVHITDFHVGDPRGFKENIMETLGWKSIKQCIKEINLLHPDFVIVSGDLVYGQIYFKEYTREYQLLYSMLQKFDVPIYIAPGNHDGYNRILEDGLEFWNTYFGPHYYSFDYGDSHFQAINSYDQSPLERFSIFIIALNWGGSISDTQLAWIENDLQNSANSELKYMFMHHNPLWETSDHSLTKKPYQNREVLLSLIEIYNIDMVLAGHVHYDNITIQNDTIFVTTTTPESEIWVPDGYWGYRLITIQNNKIISYNYKEPKYSIPSYNLSTTEKTAYTKIVKNDLEMPITAHLKFILPKGKYIAHNGVITNQRENTIMAELYVETKVPAKNSTLVTIQPMKN